MRNFLCAVLGSLVLAGCGVEQGHEAANPPKERCDFAFAKHGLCGTLEWTKVPRADGKGSFQLTFWEKTGSFAAGPHVDPGVVEVVLGLPPPRDCCSEDATIDLDPMRGDRRLVKDLTLSLRGKWKIAVQVVAGGVTERRTIEYNHAP